MPTPNLRRFQLEVDAVVNYLEGLISGQPISSTLPPQIESILKPVPTTNHAKALLPLCDVVGIAWRRAMPTMDRATDCAFILAASALPTVNNTFDMETLMLDASPWAPGERLRLLAPLAALLDYAQASSGLQAVPFQGNPTRLMHEDGSGYDGDLVILSTLVNAILAAQRIESAIQRATSAGATNIRECQAALQAGFSMDKAENAAWGVVRALGRAAPTVGDLELRLRAFGICTGFPSFAIVMESLDKLSDSVITRAIDASHLFVSAASVVAERPEEVKGAGEVQIPALSALANLVASNMLVRGLSEVRDAVAAPQAYAALTALSRIAREVALEGDSSRAAMLWTCTSILRIHPPRSWSNEAGCDVAPPAVIIQALRDATEAFHLLTARRDAVHPIYYGRACGQLLDSFFYAMTGILSNPGDVSKLPGVRNGCLTLYLIHARANAADYAAVLQAVRALLLAAPHGNPSDIIRSAVLPVFPLVTPPFLPAFVLMEHATIAVETAIDLLKFSLGPIPGSLKPMQGIPSRSSFAWVFSAAFADACVMLSKAHGEARQVAELALAAAALKYLHVVARERAAMKGVFLRGDMAPLSIAHDYKDVVAQNCRIIAAKFADMKETLMPALAVADAEGLKVLCEVMDECLDGDDGLEEMAAAAGGADDQNEAAAKARARILATLDCAYLGCSKVRVQGAGGPKRCSGCRCVRYCCAEDQRADWKTHRAACRAIKAEGGG